MLQTKITLHNKNLNVSPRTSADVLRLAEVVKRNKDKQNEFAFILTIAAQMISDALRANVRNQSILHPLRYITSLLSLRYTPTVIIAKCSVMEILEAQKIVDTLENGGLDKKKVETVETQKQ